MVAFPHKLVVPQRPRHLITRSRLNELLQGIVDRRLLTITAPAGYGKTSALIDFATGTPPFPVCWYTLDRFDADPWTFIGYLTAAIQQRFPGSMAQTEVLIRQGVHTSFAAVVLLLLQEINAIGEDLIVIVDDWHLVDHVADIGELMAQLLDRCPRCRVVLASRLYPGLPDLMLLAARRQLSGLDEERLRFTAPELAAVITAEYALEVSHEHATILAERSNGWITGILLALQASDADIPALVSGEVGAEQQIYRFLGEQVFDRQSASSKEFLLQSALIDEITVERCNVLFGRRDSRLMLDQLVRQHVFISEPKPGVWRFHPLFREFLQSHFRAIDPQRYHELTLRVADDYARREQWAEAFDACISVGDLAAAQAVVAAGGQQLYAAGRIETLEQWFGVLLQDGLSASLLCLKAHVLIDRGQIHQAQLLTEQAARRAAPHERIDVLLQQATVARNSSRYTEAIARAQEVLDSPAEPGQQAAALRTLAICHIQLAQYDRAVEELDMALRIERERGDRYQLAALQIDLGRAYEALGQLHRAEEYYGQADEYWAAVGNLGERALTLNNKGVVQHLAGRYHDAFATLKAAATCAEQANFPDYQALSLASLGDLYSDLQLWSQSLAAYEQARRLSSDAFLTSYVALMNVRLLVRQRRYAAASQALERLPAVMTDQHPVTVALLNAAIAHGLRRYDAADGFVEQALDLLHEQIVPADLARAYLLQAQIAVSRGAPREQILVALEHAQRLADDVGHDAFLVAEALHTPDLMRRAATCGWSAAEGWQQRQQQLRRMARHLEFQGDQPLLVVKALGTDQILLDDQMVDIGWLKAREILYYLLAHPNGASAEALCEAIWPELEPPKSREALRSAIYRLRSQLPRDLVVLQGRQIYRINLGVVQLDYDVERFLALLDGSDPDSLFAACDLYSGAYLPWSESDWSVGLRMYIEQRYVQALRAAAATCVQAQSYADALFLFQRALVIDELDEAAHAGVMRCQIALGNRAAAIDQYRQLRALLSLELGLDPGMHSEAEQLYHDLLATP